MNPLSSRQQSHPLAKAILSLSPSHSYTLLTWTYLPILQTLTRETTRVYWRYIFYTLVACNTCTYLPTYLPLYVGTRKNGLHAPIRSRNRTHICIRIQQNVFYRLVGRYRCLHQHVHISTSAHTGLVHARYVSTATTTTLTATKATARTNIIKRFINNSFIPKT